MRVGFDASARDLPHSTGVRRVARALLDTLEARAVLEVVRLAPAPGQNLRRWRQRDLPRAVASAGLVGIHSFTSAFPWRGKGSRVQTIHELPWRHGITENAGFSHRLWAALGPCRATRVICPTQHVARDLQERSNVRVIHWGVAKSFAAEPPLGTIDEALLERYRLGGDPIVFCPGAVRAKKNLAAVLGGAEQLAKQGKKVELVVTGPDTPDLRRDLGLASRLGLAASVTTLGDVDEADLPGLYRLAAVVPVLSQSEGFALPVLESIACGTPVVVPADTAQSEVAGDDAFQVDPADPTSVARGLWNAIERREELRYRLPARAALFSWEAAAEKVEQLWSEIGGK